MEFFIHAQDFVLQAIDIFLHVDVHLNNLIVMMGPWIYLFLFLIIFCETGLVVTPFLPGDSLLFAAGALAAIDGSPMNVHILAVLLILGAILGDATNYAIGHHVGPKIFARENSRFLNRAHLDHTRLFYEKHGGKTVILARFFPIIRTFAPFVAGIGRMSYQRFASYNVIGAVAWVIPFLYGGFFLGNIPQIKDNFHIVIVAILVISAAPAVIEFIRMRRASVRAAEAKVLR